MRRSSTALAGDVPLVGNIGPGGKSSLIVYRNGMWYIDTNRDGTTDSVVGFGGVPGDIPLTANFSGPGALDDLVIYRAGVWYVDTDLSGSANLTFMFGGAPGDIPLAGDVNGDGMADLAIYRNGIWYIDTNRNGTADLMVGFGGMAKDIPLLFDWNGDGKADLCLFRDGDVVREHEARRRGGCDLRLRRRRATCPCSASFTDRRSRAAWVAMLAICRGPGSDGSQGSWQ